MPADPHSHVPLADGTHTGMRWWVERVPGLTHPLVTIIGWCDGRYVSERVEMAGACPAKVRAWVDSVLLTCRTKPGGAQPGRKPAAAGPGP